MKSRQNALKWVALLGLVLCLLASGAMPVAMAEETEEVTLLGAGTACSGHVLNWHEASGQNVCTDSDGNIHIWCPKNFPDEGFRQLVVDKYANGNHADPKTMAEVTGISLDGCGNLKGLELFTGLKQLSIKNTKAASLDLTGLINLSSLTIDSRIVETLDLTGLTNLRVLTLSNTYDLETLIMDAEYPKMTKATIWLYVDESAASGTLDLRGFPKLTVLDLVTNMKVHLGVYPNLKELSIDASNYQTGALDLSGSELLEKVTLIRASLERLDLSDCPKLESLVLEKSEAVGSVDVSNCPKLEELDIKKSGANLLNISGCTSLESLDATGCPFPKLAASGSSGLIYGSNQKLKSLRLADSAIRTMDLRVFPALETVSFSNLSELTSVTLSNKALKQIYLAQCPLLKTLDLSGCLALETVTIPDNTGLSSLNLEDLHRLKSLHLGKTTVDVLDLSDCWSIESVLTSSAYYAAKGTLVIPKGMPYGTFDGWGKDQFDDDETPYADLKGSGSFQYAKWSNGCKLTFYTGDSAYFTRRTTYCYTAPDLDDRKFMGWGLYSDSQVDYRPGDTIYVDAESMGFYAIYGRYCQVNYEAVLSSQVSYTQDFLLPYGQDTYELQLGKDAHGDDVEFDPIPGRKQIGWIVYDLEGEYPDDPNYYGMTDSVELHGDVLILADYEIVVSELEIEVPEPAVDGNPGEAVLEMDGIQSITTVWYKFWNGSPLVKLNAESVFASGETYRCYIELMLKEGYCYADAPQITTPGMAFDFSSRDGRYLQIYCDFTPKSPFVNIVDLIRPVAGMKVDDAKEYKLYASYPCIKTSFRWLDENNNEVTGTFEAGEKYVAEISIASRKGEFADADTLEYDVKLNNQASMKPATEVSPNGKTCVFRIPMTVPKNLVSLTVPLPETYSAGSAGVAYSVDSSTNVGFTVRESKWKKTTDGGDFYGVFYPGATYEAYFRLDATTNFQNTGFLINGKVPIVKYYNTQMHAVYLTMEMEVPMKYLVRFYNNGGAGSMNDTPRAEGEELILPTSMFEAPAGKIFDCWVIDGETYLEGTPITVTKDLHIYARWKDIPPASIAGSYSGGTVTVTAENLANHMNGVVYVAQYDNDGKMKAIWTGTVTFAAPSYEISELTYVTGDTFTAFLLDEETLAPLCLSDTF